MKKFMNFENLNELNMNSRFLNELNPEFRSRVHDIQIGALASLHQIGLL
jgi:hypothetical protein